MIDYHVHSERSGDANGSILEACASAVNAGLTHICFTEHVDFEPTDSSYGFFNYTLYRDQVDAAREAFADKLNISFGIEVDYQKRYSSQISDFFDGKDFDYIIGSAHYIDGILLEEHERYFPGKELKQAYEPYFNNVLAVVETGWFDTLAHMDLCKRYGVRYFGPFDPEPHWEQITGILKAVIDKGMTLEVNTSGLRQSPKDTYPSEKIVEQYYVMGGRSTIVGSDAHNPNDIGAGISTALDMVRKVGFNSVDIYSKRQRSIITLDKLPKQITGRIYEQYTRINN